MSRKNHRNHKALRRAIQAYIKSRAAALMPCAGVLYPRGAEPTLLIQPDPAARFARTVTVTKLMRQTETDECR